MAYLDAVVAGGRSRSPEVRVARYSVSNGRLRSYVALLANLISELVLRRWLLIAVVTMRRWMVARRWWCAIVSGLGRSVLVADS